MNGRDAVGDGDQQQGPDGYPRTYSVKTAALRDLDAIAWAPLALVAGVSLLYVAGLTQNLTPFGLLVAGFFAALWGFFAYRFNRRRVVLYEDGIAVSGLFSTRMLKRSEIVGRKGTISRYGYLYVIVPVDKTAGELRLPLHPTRQAVFLMDEGHSTNP